MKTLGILFLSGVTFVGCEGLEAQRETFDVSVSHQADIAQTRETPDSHVQDSSNQDDSRAATTVEDLSVENIWTGDELAELPIGTQGVVRTVLQGFVFTDLPVTLAGHANIVTNYNEPFLLFHGVAGTDGHNPWSKWGGAAAGMSGSPIIVDGRVVAALSYGLSGPEHTEPFQFGATPAHLMAELKGEPFAAKAGSSENVSTMRSLGLLCMSGGERSINLFVDALASRGFTPTMRLATAGSARGIKDAEIPALTAGSAIAIPFVLPQGEDGVFSATAIGTVTMLSEDHLWAFGHPMSMAGVVSLPYTAAWIDSTFGDSFMPFKVGVAVGPILGTIVEDRTTAIVGVRGQIPKMIPSTSVVHYGAQANVFRHLIADTSNLPQIAPLEVLIGLTSFLPVDVKTDQRGVEATEIAMFSVKVAGSSVPAKFRIVMSTFDPSPSAFYETLNQLFRLTSGFGEVAIEQVDSNITYKPGLRVVTIDYVELPDEVMPGEPLTLTVHYHLAGSWDVYEKNFTFDLPKEFEPGAMLNVRVGQKSFNFYDPASGLEQDEACHPIYPKSVEEWVTHFNNTTTSADVAEVSVETENTDLLKCQEACNPTVELDPTSTEPPPPPPEPDTKCMDGCNVKFKCVQPHRVVQVWSIPDHVISLEANGSSKIVDDSQESPPKP